MTPERERELALLVAGYIANSAGIGMIPHINAQAAALRTCHLPELHELPFPEQNDAYDRIAALAQTARVTIEIPEQP